LWGEPVTLYIPFDYLKAQTMMDRRHVTVMVIGAIVAAGTNIAWTEFPDKIVYAQNVTGPTGFPPPELATGGNLTTNDTISEPNSSNGNISPLNNLIIDHAGGEFTSLQTDLDNKTWIATGTWDLVSEPPNTNQSNSSTVQFNATINMRETDNSDEHEHKVSEFRLTNSSISSSNEGSTLVFNGTGTIETDIGLYSDVPIGIKIIDESPAIVSIDTQTNQIEPQWIARGGTISVLIDERIEDHFGVTPVYGEVKRE
jgi:hypothetical protein